MPRRKRFDRPAVGPKEAIAAAERLHDARAAKDNGEAVDPDTTSEAAVLLGKRRAALATNKEWREMSRKAGKASWKGMSARQRSLEMRRRAAVRRKKVRARLRAKLGKED